eukprot:7517040-Lingulodinium_polyedra.AAC.1
MGCSTARAGTAPPSPARPRRGPGAGLSWADAGPVGVDFLAPALARRCLPGEAGVAFLRDLGNGQEGGVG